MSEKPINVTQPSMPPLEEFYPYLESIWRSGRLTNGGPYHDELELALSSYLGVEYVSVFNNGTTALMVALKALELSGEVITTPYSFIATSNALLWNGLVPVFSDVQSETGNLDPSGIEAVITPRTSAILPVHCYGNPCDVDAISEVAGRHGLKLIYDAAHAFGVRYRGESILVHGDLSVLSFHATKVFNTFEGGAIVCPDVDTKQKVDRLRSFGVLDELNADMVGLNGKLSEINCAFGLLQLDHMAGWLDARRRIDCHYRQALADVKGITMPAFSNDVVPNYSYFPVFIEPNFPIARDELLQVLRDHGVHARRYFFPLIPHFSAYQEVRGNIKCSLDVAERMSKKVICLPIHSSMTDEDVGRVVSLLEAFS